MDMLTVTMFNNFKLLSVPVNKVTGIGENAGHGGFLTVEGNPSPILTIEDYLTLMDMWTNLTGTGE